MNGSALQISSKTGNAASWENNWQLYYALYCHRLVDGNTHPYTQQTDDLAFIAR